MDPDKSLVRKKSILNVPSTLDWWRAARGETAARQTELPFSMDAEIGPRMRQLRAVYAKALHQSIRDFKASPADSFFPSLLQPQKPLACAMREELLATMRHNMEVRML